MADAVIPVQMIDDGDALGENTCNNTMTNNIDEYSGREKSFEEMHDIDVSVRDDNRNQFFWGYLDTQMVIQMRVQTWKGEFVIITLVG